MPPFLEQTLHWARMTGGHFFLMFWWIWLGAVVLTAVSESWLVEPWRRRLLDAPDDGLRTVGRAAVLGFLSPPSRSRIFDQARELVARDVSRTGVLAYLLSAQSILLWFLFFVVELDGPQPALGQIVAVAGLVAVVLRGAARMPDGLWSEARERARKRRSAEDRTPAVEGGAAGSAAIPAMRTAVGGPAPIARSGPGWLRPLKSVAGQAWSLWWPLLFGTLGVGFFLALGQSRAYVSLQGTKGPLIQAGNALVGLLVGYVTGAPLVGNALFAAGLWKAQFVTYAGLSAFYLATLVMPFTLPRYYGLLGPT
ncbi:MAG: hypothetical protein GWM92_17655, partial [Gemmatimonadetes bacterium]|nr:hypothetical protein [Gemmatimonadota bacterium]NIR78203.1 hypothetical protein [Gemmatimonadota bacterium]NIT89386.1 hypothetical protein [Gemmatimonadota bacterium]NIU30353.1 hypothetical protein [Gemmatimonadota bacterium]NIU35238.1 hypothetical protein [Gemmatimonadota bacterium]